MRPQSCQTRAEVVHFSALRFRSTRCRRFPPPSLSLFLCVSHFSFPLPASVFATPNPPILPSVRLASSYATFQPRLSSRSTPRSLLFVRPYHHSPPPPPLLFFFRAFPSCILVLPFIATPSSRVPLFLSSASHHLFQPTARFDARATNPPWRTTPIPCVAFSLSLVIIAVLVCSFFVIVDDSRKQCRLLLNFNSSDYFLRYVYFTRYKKNRQFD